MRADNGPRPAKPTRVRVRAKPNPQVFGPLKPATAPLKQAQHQAHVKTQRAQRKVEANTTVPYVPKLKHPSSGQRGAAVSLVAVSLHRQGITTPAQIKALPKEQRQRVRQATAYANTNARMVAKMPKGAIAQVLPGHGKAHPSVGIPGVASIDLVPIERKLAGNPISALVKAVPAAAALTAKQKGVIGLSGRALQDAIDLPANTITSTYLIGKEAATGHPGKAVKDIYDPIKQTVEHPIKSFGQHPLNTLLIARGLEGGIGHGAGRIMRTGVLGKTVKAAGAVDREVRTIPNARVTSTRTGSGDVLAKGARRVVRKVTGKQPRSVMNTRDINRRVNEDVQAAKVISAEHEHHALVDAKQAIGRKPTAATVLAAKGVTNATRADLERYLAEIRAEHPGLVTGEERKANERLQRQIVAALKTHHDEQVQKAAKAYSDLRQPQEGEVVAHELVKPAVAEQARFAGPAVRQGATVASKRTAVAAGRQAREDTRKVKVRARQSVAKADQQVQQALADARVSNVRTKASPALNAAVREQSAAVRALARLNRQRRGTKETTVTNAAVLRGARDRVRAANAAVVTERARIRGVAPREADRLLNALHERDQQRVARTGAVAEHNAAVATHRAAKAAPFADESLRPVTVQQVRAKRGEGAIEPAFVTESPIARRSAALPSERVSIPVKEMRTGEAVRKGLLDAHPATLLEQSMATSRMLDAAKAREKFIEDFGYRAQPHEDVQRFATRKAAEGHATQAADSTGVKWSPVQRQDGSWAAIPSDALHQLSRHEQAVNVHPAMKVVTAQWRKNVLAFSPRWLTGNTLEAALRSLVSGAGPTNYAVGKLALRQLKKTDPAAYEQARARIVGGGNYATAQRVSNERVQAEDLAGFSKAVYRLRNTHGPKELADAYGGYTRAVFNTLNGRIESQFQTALLGRALRDHPIMDSRVVRLSSKAIQDAAEGLRNTDAQVELGRAVDRMYGQYQKFGPGLRNAVSTYTPFIAWTLNAVNFLYHVLPVDHPVMTSLIASSSQATEGWRKQHGLYLDFLGKTAAQLPPWLQGSIPGKAGSHLRLSRYTPFGLLGNDSGTPIGGLQSLVLPQLSEILQNLSGKDFLGNDLSKNPNGARDLIAAAASFLEGQIPAAQNATGILGVHLPNQRDSAKTPGGVNRTLNPFFYTPASNKKGASKDPLAAKYGLSGGSNLDDLAKKYGVTGGTSTDDLAKKYGLK